MTNPKASLPPHSARPSQTSVLPPESSREPIARRASVSTPAPPSSIGSRVMVRHAQLSRLNHFEVLEVPENADDDTIRRAFNQALRKFHPDLLRDAEERMRPFAQEIVCRIGAAFKVLENAGTRQQYLQSLRNYPHLSALHSKPPSSRASQPALRAPSSSNMPSAQASQPGFRPSGIPTMRPSQPGFRAPSSSGMQSPQASQPGFRPSSPPGSRPSQPGFRPSSPPGSRPSQPGFRAPSVPNARASQPGFRATPPSGGRSAQSSASLAAAGSWTPEQAFAAARIHLKRGAFQDAMALAEQACMAEPTHPQYLALHAWLRVERGELQAGPVADEILATLTWAVRQERTDLDIRLYRGRVLSRLGRRDEAMRDFSVVASMDEKNLEAIREVRLYRAREEQAAANSGLFSKFFKRP